MTQSNPLPLFLSACLGLMFLCFVNIYASRSRSFNPQERRKTSEGIPYSFSCDTPRHLIVSECCSDTFRLQTWRVAITSQSSITLFVYKNEIKQQRPDEVDRCAKDGTNYDSILNNMAVVSTTDKSINEKLTRCLGFQRVVLHALTMGVTQLISEPAGQVIAIVCGDSRNSAINWPRHRILDEIVRCLVEIDSMLVQKQ